MRRVCTSQPKPYSPWGVTEMCCKKFGFDASAPGMLARWMTHQLSGFSHEGGIRMIAPTKLAGNVQCSKVVQGRSKSSFYSGMTQVFLVLLLEWNCFSEIPYCVSHWNTRVSTAVLCLMKLPVGLDFATWLGHNVSMSLFYSLRFLYFIQICDIWTKSILPKDCPPIPWLL